jgi:hypothetical protein
MEEQKTLICQTNSEQKEQCNTSNYTIEPYLEKQHCTDPQTQKYRPNRIE